MDIINPHMFHVRALLEELYRNHVVYAQADDEPEDDNDDDGEDDDSEF